MNLLKLFETYNFYLIAFLFLWSSEVSFIDQKNVNMKNANGIRHLRRSKGTAPLISHNPELVEIEQSPRRFCHVQRLHKNVCIHPATFDWPVLNLSWGEIFQMEILYIYISGDEFRTGWSGFFVALRGHVTPQLYTKTSAFMSEGICKQIIIMLKLSIFYWVCKFHVPVSGREITNFWKKWTIQLKRSLFVVRLRSEQKSAFCTITMTLLRFRDSNFFYRMCKFNRASLEITNLWKKWKIELKLYFFVLHLKSNQNKLL